MRGQSVLEILEEGRLFMFCRLTERDDANLAWGFPYAIDTVNPSRRPSVANLGSE
jgi:hypothetical protein